MYITVSAIQVNSNPHSISLAFTVVSSGGTQTGAETQVDDDATPEEISDAIAEAARQACRSNNEDIATDALVTIFGGVVQVGA